mgnify:CR=1 FL=1
MATAELIDSQNWKEISKLCQKSRNIVDAVRLGTAIKDIPDTALFSEKKGLP